MSGASTRPLAPRLPEAVSSRRGFSIRMVLVPYLAVLAVAEIAAAVDAPVAAVIVAGGAALALAAHSATISRPASVLRRPARPSIDALLLAALALVPVTALAYAATARKELPVEARPALVALTVLVGVVAVARAFELRPRDLGLRLGRWPTQGLIALSGLPLGVAAFLVAGEEPLGAVVRDGADAGTVAIVVAVAAMIEELFFRGLVTGAFLRSLGAAGIPWSSVVFALPAVATGSAGLVLVLLACGLLWGWAYARTDSILGTGLAHALLATGFVVGWPALLG